MRRLVMSLLLAASMLVPFSPVLAEKCFVCGAIGDNFSRCQEQAVPGFSRTICREHCFFSDYLSYCFCATSGPVCAVTPPDDQGLETPGPSPDQEPLFVMPHTSAEQLVDIDPLLVFLLSRPIYEQGPMEGALSVLDADGRLIGRYPFTAEISIRQDTVELAFELEGYHQATSIAGRFSKKGITGEVSIETPEGTRVVHHLPIAQ